MRQHAPLLALGLALVACNPPPDEPVQGIVYRDGLTDDWESGERGNIKISEILWSGSVTNDKVWDPDDVFIEIRNEGTRPINLSRWQLMNRGNIEETWVLPETDTQLNVGDHLLIAAKTTGCFPEPDLVIPGLIVTRGGPFYLTLTDADERLIDSAGDRSTEMPAYAGGYDGKVSRSMEKIEMMFGGRGGEPASWHFYTEAEVDVPNNDRVAEACRRRTLASPGRPNSPDYSGAYATGSFE